MIYCFDIDGTLCTNTDGDYANARPFRNVIAEVNRLFDEGCRVVLYTARGATTGIDWTELTTLQLEEWNVQHHALYMGKPGADVYIDDKGMSLVEWKRNGFRLNPPSPNEGRSEETDG